MIHRTSKTGNFTIADNGFSVDPNLDWDAKGMLIYLLTKPDKWRINKGNLIRVVHGAGEKRIESILKKLETARYLIRWQSRNSKGQIIYDCEILESFWQYEDVRNALIAKHSGDKHFKITAPPLSQCGSNKNSKTQNDEKPSGVRRLSAQENEVEKLTALAKPTCAESSPGAGVPLVNTDKELNPDSINTDQIKDPLYPPEGDAVENFFSKTPSADEIGSALPQNHSLSTLVLAPIDDPPPRNENGSQITKFEAAFNSRAKYSKHTSREAQALAAMGLPHLWVGPGRNDYAPELIEAIKAKKTEWKQPCKPADIFIYIRNCIDNFRQGGCADGTLQDLYDEGTRILGKAKEPPKTAPSGQDERTWQAAELARLERSLAAEQAKDPSSALAILFIQKIALFNENIEE